ncbi:HAMP domain-containing sensor histidine kinase [Paenochrobactrum glaciei]|uniref:histidine kinase n=1 Tax=Paenochrobactrum glaciei TaxID=486407 RepID=A0ABN1GF96_9HYPH
MKITRAYTVAGIVMLGFCLMLTYAFYQLLRVERSLETYVGENMLWAVNQADRESRRFSDTLLLDSHDKEMITLRFDILKSRINLLSSEPQLGYFKSIGAEEYLKNIVATMEQIEARYEAEDSLEQAEILSIYREVLPVFSDFGRIANLSMIHERDAGGADRDRQLNIIYLTMSAVLGLMTVGGLLSFLLIMNIKSANRANDELLRYQEELEAIVAQRTEALSVALKNEQKSNEIYKGFLTTVSHQFKTPVAIIDLIAQRFIRHPEDINSEAVTEAAGRIREAVSRLSRIVESTISGDVIHGHGVKLKAEEFDLVEMVRQSIAYHQEIHPARFVHFEEQVSQVLYHGDKTLLEQIVVNLLANADKYSAGSTPVDVTVLLEDDTFICRVKDVGVGIPENETDMVFNRFYRASNVAHLSGSGLGLSFSRQIAQMHGGDLTLLATGKGFTEFELRLPLTGIECA